MKTGLIIKQGITAVFLMSATNIFAHREWTHQYIVGEGLLFVEKMYQNGTINKVSRTDLEALKSQIFYSDGTLYGGHGNNDTPWEDSEGKYVSEDFLKIIIATGCSGVAAGVYSVKRHEIIKDVTYPFTQAPFIIGTASGLSLASPNDGNFFMDAINVTETSARLRTFVYETFDILNRQIGFVPSPPSSIKFNFAVLSAVEQNIFLQNEEISTGSRIYNAMNEILVGDNVTTSNTAGNYLVEGNANITLHTSNLIVLRSGTTINSSTNASFRAYVDPFFTCTQYPMGKKANDSSEITPVIKDYAVQKIDTKDSSSNTPILIRNYPNPFIDNTIIEYKIAKSALVTITIYDNCGRTFYMLKNQYPHESGTYQITLTGIQLPPGAYFCTLHADDYSETKQIIKIE